MKKQVTSPEHLYTLLEVSVSAWTCTLQTTPHIFYKPLTAIIQSCAIKNKINDVLRWNKLDLQQTNGIYNGTVLISTALYNHYATLDVTGKIKRNNSDGKIRELTFKNNKTVSNCEISKYYNLIVNSSSSLPN